MDSWIAETTTSSKRRDKLCIIAEIIEIAKEGILKTQIMYKASLSFAQLNEYLKFMLKIRLIEKIDSSGKDVYIATRKGLEFLKLQNEVLQLVKPDSSAFPESEDQLLAEIPPNRRKK